MTAPHYTNAAVTLWHGDCVDVLRGMPDASVDAVVTDPPYGLEFMGKDWDSFKVVPSGGAGMTATGYTDGSIRLARPSFTGSPNPPCRRCGGTQRGADGQGVKRCHCVDPDFPNVRRAQSAAFGAWCEVWAAECLRVLKPGGHLLAFGGTRTSHRLACAIEDAGFEIRDTITWLYAQGFPKSLNVSRDPSVCQCETVDRAHTTTPPTQHVVPRVHDAHVPQASRTGAGPGPLLLPALPEQGAPGHGTAALVGEVGRAERGVERGRDLQAAERELHRPEVRTVPAGSPSDGTGGWLRDGAPPRDGAVDPSAAAAIRGGQPREPRSSGQPAGEPRALSVERGSQAGRGRPVCGGCGKPVVPRGLGTALKPASEPVVVARKPLAGTVAATVLAYGTGALNIDACRVGADGGRKRSGEAPQGRAVAAVYAGPADYAHAASLVPGLGRWPANVVLTHPQADDGGDACATGCVPGCPVADLDAQSGNLKTRDAISANPGGVASIGMGAGGTSTIGYGDEGGASRFFPTFRYQAKADTAQRPRAGLTSHPTVKPLDLMRWLVRLVTPPGGTVLDLFAGSGTTGEACTLEGFRCWLVEREADYLPLIVDRLTRRTDPVAHLTAKAARGEPVDLGLFADLEDGTPA